MADDITVTPGTGATVSAADTTTLNGGAVTTKVQRFRAGYGTGATHRDVDLTFPMPTDERMVGGVAITAFPAGFSRVTDEPHQLFYDPFDSFDTTNRWNAGVNAGGGVAAAVSAGVLTLGTGTTANGYSYLATQASFVPTVPAWLGNSWAIQIESGATAGNNATRFWGHGLVSGSVPAGATPLGTTGNAYGFELDASGVLQAVIYAAGTRTAVASLAALQPTDGAYHRYICYYRTDKIYWYIDGLGAAQLAATSNFQGPAIQTLPLLALCVAGASAPVASRVFTCAGVAIWDTGKNNNTLSDGTYPWRKLLVSAAGSIATTGGNLANATVTNRSGTITAGGTAQTLAVANTARTGLTIQNISAGDLMVTEDGATTASLTAGYRIRPNGTAKVNTQKLIQIWGATTAQAFTATEF